LFGHQAKYTVNIFLRKILKVLLELKVLSNNPFNLLIVHKKHKQTSCLANRSPKYAATKQFIFRGWFWGFAKGLGRWLLRSTLTRKGCFKNLIFSVRGNVKC
jgi:hypothetical protein